MTQKEDYDRRKADQQSAIARRRSERFFERLKDPLTLFTAILATATVGLGLLAGLQWQTLEKTDHTLRSGQRGFAFVKSTWWRPYARQSGLVWWALPEWENSGNTPIMHVDIELSCPSFDGSGQDVFDPYVLKRVMDRTGKTYRLNTQIGPKQTKFGGNCEFAVGDMQSIQDSKKTQYVIAQATYEDIYGEAHSTRFCERIYNIKGALAVADKAIEVASIPCVRYNCSDDDCKREDAEPDLPPEKLLPLKPSSVSK
jgi:hypothetical protein